jgi:hypothetical protein
MRTDTVVLSIETFNYDRWPRQSHDGASSRRPPSTSVRRPVRGAGPSVRPSVRPSHTTRATERDRPSPPRHPRRVSTLHVVRRCLPACRHPNPNLSACWHAPAFCGWVLCTMQMRNNTPTQVGEKGQTPSTAARPVNNSHITIPAVHDDITMGPVLEKEKHLC